MLRQQPVQKNPDYAKFPAGSKLCVTFIYTDVTPFNLNKLVFLDFLKGIQQGNTFLSSYRALILQAHHEGAHISCGLVVDNDHGFLFRDGPNIITPLCYCKKKYKDTFWLNSVWK